MFIFLYCVKSNLIDTILTTKLFPFHVSISNKNAKNKWNSPIFKMQIGKTEVKSRKIHDAFLFSCSTPKYILDKLYKNYLTNSDLPNQCLRTASHSFCFPPPAKTCRENPSYTHIACRELPKNFSKIRPSDGNP